MVTKQKTRIRLTDRDVEVLTHIDRYVMSTRQAIDSLPCFGESGKHAGATVRRRLVSGGYLESARLYAKRRYYFLTRRGLDVLGAKHTNASAKPLSLQARIRAFAILHFCCLDEVKRELLTNEELERLFPGIHTSGRRSCYYIDREGEHDRLAKLRVDFGKESSIRRETVITYLRRDTTKLLSNSALREFQLGDRLQITFITCLESKAKLIKKTLEERNEDLPIPFRIHVIPTELRELVAPLKY